MLIVSDNHIVLGGGGGGSGGGGGDVVGAASSTDNALARFDGTTGKAVQDSKVIIADNGSVSISGNTGLKLKVVGNTPSTADLDIPEISLANQSAAGTVLSKYALGGGYATGDLEMWLSASGYFGESHVRNVSNHPLSFWTNNTKRLTVEANGVTYARAGLRISGALIDNNNSAGTDGQGLKKVGGLVKWSNNLSSCSVFNTPTAGTQTGVLSLNVKKHDIANEFNTTTNRFTVTVAGLYLLNASVLKQGGVETKMYFRKNGSTFGSGASRGVESYNGIMDIMEIIPLSVGDYIDVFVSAGFVITDFETNKFSAALLS